MCVCVRERGRERECVCVCVRARACACVREREREVYICSIFFSYSERFIAAMSDTVKTVNAAGHSYVQFLLWDELTACSKYINPPGFTD